MTKIPVSILLGLFLNCQAISQTIAREGLVNYQTAFDENHSNFTWFKDSVIISENYTFYSEEINDTVTDKGRKISHYTILDLKTMRAQDYLVFSDTAKPINNYYVQQQDVYNTWGVYRKAHFYDKYLDSMHTIPDTVIDNNTYRRSYFIVSGNGWANKITYYVLCPVRETLFHMSKAADERHPGCKVTMVQYDDFKNKPGLIQLELVRAGLESKEQNIFSAWEKNLATFTLPATTLDEARQLLWKSLDHR